ncbi:hypothetical protein DFH27DRAFT_363713 [Peziza echinospora]|nr:hypothetical protein DFH27DRAFT_363713 [Peziza echinospora]
MSNWSGSSDKGRKTWKSGKYTVSMGGPGTPPFSDNSSVSSSGGPCPPWGSNGGRGSGWGTVDINGDGQHHNINSNNFPWGGSGPPCGPPGGSAGMPQGGPGPWSAWPFNGHNPSSGPWPTPPSGPWPMPPQGWGGPGGPFQWGRGPCSCPCDGPQDQCTGSKKTCPNLPKNNQNGSKSGDKDGKKTDDNHGDGPKKTGDNHGDGPKKTGDNHGDGPRKTGDNNYGDGPRKTGDKTDTRNPEELEWEREQEGKKGGTHNNDDDDQPTRNPDGSYTFTHGSNSVRIGSGYGGRYSSGYGYAPPPYRP